MLEKPEMPAAASVVIGPAELPIERRGEIGELLIARHVARGNEWVLQRRRELADVFLEPPARIRQREARARRRGGLRDRPRDRSLVGDADDQSLFSRKIR